MGFDGRDSGEVPIPATAVPHLSVAAMVPSLTAVDEGGAPLTPGLLYGDARGRADDLDDVRVVTLRLAGDRDVVFGAFAQKQAGRTRSLGSRVIGLVNRRVFGQPRDLVVTNFRLLHRDVVGRRPPPLGTSTGWNSRGSAPTRR